MRYLTLAEVLEVHRRVIEQSGGSPLIRDWGALTAAVAQPQMTFEGRDLYPAAPEKAAALCFSVINGHPFVDGNKRTGHAAMEVFLYLNGMELDASVEEQESVILAAASGTLNQADFAGWLSDRVVPIKGRE